MMMLKDVSPSDCPVSPPDGHLAFTACREGGTPLLVTHAASLSALTATRSVCQQREPKKG